MAFNANFTCRVCMRKDDNPVSLLDSTYSSQLRLCANIDIDNFDGLPVVICRDCLKELPLAYHFVIKCQESDRRFRELLLNEQHMQDVNDGISDYGGSSEPKLKVKVIKEKIAQCQVCGLVFNSCAALRIHNRTHTGEKLFKCEDCGKAFGYKGTLMGHIIRFHTDFKRMFTCEVCGKQFFRKKDVAVHMRCHTGETPFCCSFCPKKFTQQATLVRHIRIHTGEKPYSCKVCLKQFAGSFSLKRHLLVHSNEKKFKCNFCNKQIKSKDTLKSHLLLHTNNKKYICDHCDLAFSTKGSLKVHIENIHSSTSGVCNTCNRQYSKLPDHMRRHTGETPFQCHICSKRFMLLRSLSRHVSKYCKGENFSCTEDKCTKTFHSKKLMGSHMLQHHINQTPYLCYKCNKGFFRKSDLTRHHNLSHRVKE